MTITDEATLITAMEAFVKEFDVRLSELTDKVDGVPATLVEAVRYSLLAPGKRVRPFLVYRCNALVGGDFDSAFPGAAAMEMVHAFSLIHDDLPSMDDDDLRRGQPTCHRRYGEATAILAGDALQALAFETLTTKVSDPVLAAGLCKELACNCGWSGMIGGQMADLTGEDEPNSLSLAEYIHERKTAALFISSCRMGGMLGGASESQLEKMSTFGRHLGLAFQIADDLLDETSTTGRMGKKVGKDAERQKQTYPACVGIEESREAADKAVATAISALEGFGEAANELRTLARFAVSRTY